MQPPASPPAWPLPFKYERAAFLLEVGDADAHRVLTELLQLRISAANSGDTANIVTTHVFCDGSRRSNTTPTYVIVEDIAYPLVQHVRSAPQPTASRAVRLSSALLFEFDSNFCHTRTRFTR